MIRFFAFLFFLTVMPLQVIAQNEDEPVVWEQQINKISDTEYELVMQAKILDGWHMYSQFTSEFGSLPSEFTYNGNGTIYELIDGTIESETIKEYSEIFEVEETYFKDEATFTQRIKILDPEINQIDVDLFFQVCKEVCIPMDKKFMFTLDGSEAEIINTVDDRSLALGG